MNPLRVAQTQRKISLTRALIFAAQAAVCTLLVAGLYGWRGWSGSMWAAVSAVLVLQPGVQGSLKASIVRVLANLLGAGIGVVVGVAFQNRLAAICVSLVLLILVCELLRLDAGVRSACASLLIVTMTPDSSLIHRGVERASAVGMGCAIALALQFAVQPFRTDHRAASGGDDSE